MTNHFENEASMTNHFENEAGLVSIERLPDEVLHIVLAHVQNISVKHLARSIRVSKRWCVLGTELLWHNVVLNYAEISAFARCIQVNVLVPEFRQSLANCRLRSLTIHGSIEAERFSFLHTAQSHRTLHDLSRILPKLSGLHTFSFNHSNTSADPWSLDQMTDEIVVSLVEELPPSIRHLELNCPTVYFRRPRTDLCLCALISDRLNGLQSLRLSWPRLCARLLQAGSRSLTHAVIDVCKPDLRAGVKQCGVEDQGQMSWDRVHAIGNEQSRRALAAFVAALKEKCSARDPFPMLKQFTILEPYHLSPQNSHYQWFLLNVHSITTDAVSLSQSARLVTTCYPIWPTGFVNETLDTSNQYSFILRTCTHDTKDDSATTSEHECSTNDKVIGKEAICAFLEGEAAWTSDNLHSRRPVSVSHRMIPAQTLNKLEWEAMYRSHRRKVLRENNEMTFFHHDPDLVSSLTLEGLQLFHSTHGVKAKEAGADYVWWLEKKLRQNVLWASQFPDGIYSMSADGQVVDAVKPSCFTSHEEDIRSVQTDIVYADIEDE